MWFYIYNAWGREITKDYVRDGGDALSLLKLYSNWDRAYLVSASGTPVDLYVRL